MQIELIGCTGAGKSTLARGIQQACREQGLDILLGEDFVLEQCRMDWVRSDLLRKALVNVTGILASLITWRNNRRLSLFATQLLFQLPIPRLERVSLLRNVLKKIGLYEIIRLRRRDQQVILVDEGVLQIAHNLFVHVSSGVKSEHLSTFAGLAPLSDVVVYLKQPEDLLIDRTLRRGHKRIQDRSHAKVSRFVKQAVNVFDELVQHPKVKNRVVVVEGDREVVMAMNGEESRAMDEALRIIRCGFDDDMSSPPAKVSYAEQSS